MNIFEDVTTAIMEYGFLKEQGDRQRAKICGCASCQAEYESSQDRTGWILNEGVWTKIGTCMKDGRKTVFNHAELLRDWEDGQT